MRYLVGASFHPMHLAPLNPLSGNQLASPPCRKQRTKGPLKALRRNRNAWISHAPCSLLEFGHFTSALSKKCNSTKRKLRRRCLVLLFCIAATLGGTVQQDECSESERSYSNEDLRCPLRFLTRSFHGIPNDLRFTTTRRARGHRIDWLRAPKGEFYLVLRA